MNWFSGPRLKYLDTFYASLGPVTGEFSPSKTTEKAEIIIESIDHDYIYLIYTKLHTTVKYKCVYIYITIIILSI